MTPGRPRHLMRRFFESVRARRPSPPDQAMVGEALRSEEARLFWAQPIIDQAHGVDTARILVDHRPGRPHLVKAALLHDVGKRHSSLGVIGRSMASTLTLLHLPVKGRYARYLAHAELGARDLEQAGCSAEVVAFARHHHGDRPPGFDEADWSALVAADNDL